MGLGVGVAEYKERKYVFVRLSTSWYDETISSFVLPSNSDGMWDQETFH